MTRIVYFFRRAGVQEHFRVGAFIENLPLRWKRLSLASRPRQAEGGIGGSGTLAAMARIFPEVFMGDKISALLVSEDQHLLESLKQVLENLSVQTQSVRTGGEATLALWGKQPPHLVFTDLNLPDCSWSDLIAVARKSPLPVNVIVVAPQVDVKFYLDVIENGGFDFMVPPFDAAGVAHVVCHAFENVLLRRWGATGSRAGYQCTREAPLPRPHAEPR